jgi:hypothetical protein
MRKWTTVRTVDMPATNVELKAAGRETLAVKQVLVFPFGFARRA